MARDTPLVQDGLLSPRRQPHMPSIRVGSDEWTAWLADAETTSFRFEHGSQRFSARRERKPGGFYWYAYRRQAGRLRKIYLGRDADLTLDRLERTARTLADADRTAKPDRANDAEPATTGHRSTRDGRNPTPGTTAETSGSPQGSAHPIQILSTKLYLPRARQALVRRPRLLARLEAGLAGAVTLISAPAGFGKTTLLANWLAQLTPDSSIAWLSLDAEDSDPHQWLRYVVAALQTCTPDDELTTLRLLKAPQTPALPILLRSLINDLAALTADTLLVLDDYHVLQGTAVHAALAFLVEHLPPHLHLVIATREDPPLPLARLRSRRQLSELRAADLRFTTDEAAAFLGQVMDLPLTTDDIAALATRTEGWIAGLQLAALSLQDRPDRAGFIAAFAGSHSYIVDYLVAEVFDRQPAHVQAFLLQTAVLERMCGPLCDALLLGTPESAPAPGVAEDTEPSAPPLITGGRQHAYSQTLLEALGRANLFVVPLDDARHWYRYHHLFGEVLRARLLEAEPSRVPTLYQRAAAWCEAQILIDEAVGYALAAGDQHQAARLVETHAPPLLKRGDTISLRRWLDRLGEPLLRARPRLALVYAWSLVMAADMVPIQARVEEAEQALALLPNPPPDLVGEIAALRGYIALFHGDLAASMALSRQALAIMPAETVAYGVAAYALGDAQFWSGDVTQASATFARAVDVCRVHGNRAMANVALGGLGSSLILQGRLKEAAVIARDGLAVADREGAARVTTASNLHLNLGDLYYEWNDLEAALRHLLTAREIGTLGQYRMLQIAVAEALARLHQARGDADRARAALDEAEQLVSETHDQARSALVVANRLQFDLGAVGTASPHALHAAANWAATWMLGPQDALHFRDERGQLILARVLLHLPERRSAGLGLLERLLFAAETAGRTQRVIAILALQAIGLAAQGDAAAALAALARALTLAAAEGYVRPFMDEGAPMAALLAQLAGGGSLVAAYAATLLAAFQASTFSLSHANRTKPPQQAATRQPPHAITEQLSARELEVLRLIAAGYSNPAIAAALVVAVSTVKKHINNIFGKLAVQSRTQALLRARELNLL